MPAVTGWLPYSAEHVKKAPMFTGIIEGTGTVIDFKGGKAGGRLVVSAGIPVAALSLGASVAVDGCCLTVVRKVGRKISFDVSDETRRKTIVGGYRKGRLVNLEKALRAGDPFGGHIVLGHVDGVGRVLDLKREPGSLKMTFSCPDAVARYVIEKGSVTVNGVSLTACKVGKKQFSVYLIPLTEEMTNLPWLKKEDAVNLEADVLGKYVERLISMRGK